VDWCAGLVAFSGSLTVDLESLEVDVAYFDSDIDYLLLLSVLIIESMMVAPVPCQKVRYSSE